MNCNEFAQRQLDLEPGDTEGEKALAEHLATCEVCRAEEEENDLLREMIRSVRPAPRPMPANFSQKVAEALAAPPYRRPPEPRRFPTKGVGLIVLACLLIPTAFLLRSGPPGEAPPVPAAPKLPNVKPDGGKPQTNVNDTGHGEVPGDLPKNPNDLLDPPQGVKDFADFQMQIRFKLWRDAGLRAQRLGQVTEEAPVEQLLLSAELAGRFKMKESKAVLEAVRNDPRATERQKTDAAKIAALMDQIR